MSTMLHNTQQLSSAMFHTTNLPVDSKNETISDMDRDLIKNNIRAFRESLGLSQEEFGKPLNVSRHDISRYEKGLHLTVRLLLDIEKVYNIPIGNLLHKNEIKASSPGIIDADFLLECWGAILKAAKARQRELTRAEEIVYPIMLYNHLMECRSDGMEAAPSEATASLIMKQKVA